MSKFITFDDWVSGIGEIYNFPFPKEGRTVDLRNNTSNESKIEELYTEESLKKDLANLFDNLEGFDD